MDERGPVYRSSPFRTSPFEVALATLAREGVPSRVVDHLRERWGRVLADKTAEDAARLLVRAIRLTCPRCTELIPTDEDMGDHPGAMSRTDRTPGPATEVCLRCGNEEDEIWFSAVWVGKDRLEAMREDRARWRLPEVAHPHPGAAKGSGGHR